MYTGHQQQQHRQAPESPVSLCLREYKERWAAMESITATCIYTQGMTFDFYLPSTAAIYC